MRATCCAFRVARYVFRVVFFVLRGFSQSNFETQLNVTVPRKTFPKIWKISDPEPFSCYPKFGSCADMADMDDKSADMAESADMADMVDMDEQVRIWRIWWIWRI